MKAWEYVREQLQLLHITSSDMQLVNGGQIVRSTFTTSNKAGITCSCSFGRRGLACPSDITELHISLTGKGLTIKVETNRGYWPVHKEMLKEHFGGNFVRWAEKVHCRCKMQGIKGDIGWVEWELKQVEAL